MARAYPAPDAFPGQQGQPDREPDNFDYDVPPDSAVAATISPGNNGLQGGPLAAPNPFPGYPGSQPGGGSGAGGAYGFGAGEVNESTRPQYSPMVGEHTVLNAPDAFPGGAQIPAGVPDTTGMNGQVPRLRRDDSAGGVMP